MAAATGDAAPALSLEHLTYAYGRGRRALDDIGFAVPMGSFTALLGPNGAGKTTLMALVTRLFQSATGSIRICGHDLKRQPRRALAAMGVVFQRPTLDLELSVEQNLSYASRLYGLDRRRAQERIGLCLERLDLVDRRKAAVRTLSGGLRRRVELARALLHEPQLLVLDEPTAGLDIESRRQIVDHVHALCAEGGLAVLWTTHLIDEIATGDRVVVLVEGQVRAAGSLAEVVAGAADLGEAYADLTSRPKVVA
jgi:ABC-2 type transport system ATP-binding protein